MNAVLEARNLVMRYPGASANAVDGLSLAVREGACFGLLGPNGAGKTTTVEIMEGITKPNAGEVLYRGAPLGPSFRERSGIQFQETALQEKLSVRELLALFGSLYPRTMPAEELQLRNLIIPITGNFAGTKAFPAVADYLRKYKLTVSTIYTSNVEQYLFEYEVFNGFVANIKKLPINEQSLFIRSASSRGRHPARQPGFMFTSLMQRVPVFLKDFDEGRYKTYFELVSTNYIAAGDEK